ncbi:ABC transporter permease [Kitasatospora viridis]|uniref:ABC-2 type transport system permease protein n=1 Tax=Kitasatospora viridis TaxID=281105 RepID=A0A561TVP2_9ACTN|nr:ABC transporter permease [Kitasatospora viridis]TWF91178.1 ABC-2 type transport system permease protein [Kitasatospora viridis]
MNALTGRIFRVELRDELRSILREPTSLFFGVLMPVGFFVLFNLLYGQGTVQGVSAGTAMVATFGTYGVITVASLQPGIGVAQDRDLGWLRTKRVSAVPIWVSLAAKATAALLYGVGVLLLMGVAAQAFGTLHASPWALLRVALVLLLGSVPFTLLSVAVGFQLRTGAAIALLNAVLFPLAVLSGLWIPIKMLPSAVQGIADFLPTYHLAQLGLAQLGDGSALIHVLALLLTTVLAAGVAALSYRRARL